MGLSCSLNVSTSTPRGRGAWLSVVHYGIWPSIKPLGALTAMYFLTLSGQVG